MGFMHWASSRGGPQALTREKGHASSYCRFLLFFLLNKLRFDSLILNEDDDDDDDDDDG